MDYEATLSFKGLQFGLLEGKCGLLIVKTGSGGTIYGHANKYLLLVSQIHNRYDFLYGRKSEMKSNMKLKKYIGRMVMISLLTGSFVAMPNLYETSSMAIINAETRLYIGTAEDYASPIESQEVAKLRAKEKAIQQAREQAGVVLQSYSKTIGAVLTDNEVSTITSNTYEIIGEPVYEREIKQVTDSSIVIIWRATVNVNVDDSEIRNWLKLSAKDKETYIKRSNDIQVAISENEKKVDALRSEVSNATTEEEQNRLKEAFAEIDKDFLYNQKMAEAEAFGYRLKVDEELRAYSEAIQLDPSNALGYYRRGMAYCGKAVGIKYDMYYTQNSKQTFKDCYDLAMSDFTNALQINPNYSDVYAGRGLYQMIFDKNQQALSDLNKAIQIDNNLSAYLSRANYYHHNEKNDLRALEDINRAIELYPDESSCYITRGNYRMDKEDYYGAIEDFNYAIQLCPDSACYFSRGTAFYEMKSYEKAVADFTKCIEIDPDSPSNYSMRSLCYNAMGEKEKANEDQRREKELERNV